MKNITTIFFLLLATASVAQDRAKQVLKGTGKVAGYVAGERYYMPTQGVEAFIYGNDSAIIGSGYTDSMGVYETNKITAGTYTMKFVYPGGKRLLITNVPVGGDKPTILNIKVPPPVTDTSAAYTDFASSPNPAVVKKAHAKK